MEKFTNPWKTLDSKEVYNNNWITVTEHQVINPGGGGGIYGTVSFKNLAIGIIPIDEKGFTWLVGQYRYPLNEYSWEIPMGGGNIGSDPLESAKRELKEETGLLAEEWEKILKIHTSNSVTDEVGYVYVARKLTQSGLELDETESDLKVIKVPFSDSLAMVMSGEITDSLSVAAIGERRPANAAPVLGHVWWRRSLLACRSLDLWCHSRRRRVHSVSLCRKPRYRSGHLVERR